MTAFIGQIRAAKPRRPYAAAPSLLGGGKKNAGFGEIAAEYEEKLRAAGNKAHSIDTTMGHVRKWGAWLDTQGLGLRDVRHLHLDKYVNYRRETDGVGDICVRRDVMYAKAVMKFACRRDYLYRNRLEDYALPKAARPHRKMPSPKHLWDILSAVERLKAPEHNNCLRHRGNEAASRFYVSRDQALMITGITTGARISEILNWTADNYDAKNHQFVIPTSKVDEPRYVAMEPAAVPFIKAWLQARPDDDTIRASEWFRAQEEAGNDPEPKLFVCEGGQPLLQNCWGRTFKKYCAAAGVDGITFHCLRHYNLSNLADYSVKAAMAQGGHKSLQTALMYQHNNANAQRAALLTVAPLGQVLAVGKPKRKQSLIKLS